MPPVQRFVEQVPVPVEFMHTVERQVPYPVPIVHEITREMPVPVPIPLIRHVSSNLKDNSELLIQSKLITTGSNSTACAIRCRTTHLYRTKGKLRMMA